MDYTQPYQHAREFLEKMWIKIGRVPRSHEWQICREKRQSSKIRHWELRGKLRNNFGDGKERMQWEWYNLYKEEDSIRTALKRKNGGVRFLTMKTKGEKNDGKILIPSLRSLFETKESLSKMEYVIRKLSTYIFGRLTHVHCFHKVTVKESIFDIKLAGQLREIKIPRTVRIVAGLTTWLKVPSKSRPRC